MHIVIDAHLAVKEIDGVTRYLIGLLRELPKLDESVRYSILSLPPAKSGLPDDIFEPANVTRVELDLSGPTPRQHFVIPAMLRKLDADLYHHPQYDLPRGISIPAVVTIHDLKYLFHPEFLSKASRLKSWYIRQSLRYSLNKAQRTIVVSRSTLHDLKKAFAVDEDKISVIHHGIDFDFINSGSEKLDFKISGDFILYVGTRRPHKNLDGLIRAFHILQQKENSNIELVIAGKSYSDYTEPEKVARELNLLDKVRFLDFIPETALHTLYRDAKAVILPSFYEGFGLPLVEAMAHGTPVLGSNVSSIPEVIGDAGLLFDPNSPGEIADMIRRLLDDDKLNRELSRKALARSKRFSWTSVAKKTLDLYLQVLQERHK